MSYPGRQSVRPTRRGSLAGVMAVLLASRLHGATYYVAPSATGGGTGADRSNLRAIATFKSSASPGDVALLQPGSYGAYTVDGGYGSAGSWITYRVDTGAPGYVARDADWYTQCLDVRPTTSTAPVFSSIEIPVKTDGYYVEFDGIVIIKSGGQYSYGILGRRKVSYIKFTNVDILGPGYDHANINHYLSYDFPAEGIRLDHDEDLANSMWANVTFENCHVEECIKSVQIRTKIGENVLFKNCSFLWNMYGNYIGAVGESVKFEGCIFGLSPARTVSDSGNEIAGSWTIASAGSPADTTFVYSGTDPGALINTANHDSVRVTKGATSEVRRIATCDQGTNTVVVTEAFSGVLPLDTDCAVEFFEDCHGCAFTIMNGNIHIDSCIVYDFGNTGMFYTYGDWYTGEGQNDVTIENSLFYSTRGKGQPCVDLGMGRTASTDSLPKTNFIIRNNTFVGGRNEGVAQTSGTGDAPYNYGYAFYGYIHGSATASTLQCTNNLFVGRAYINSWGHVRNNIMFYNAGGFETDSEGDNKDNVVLYNPGVVYIPFNSGWFAGDVSSCWPAGLNHTYLRDEFRLASGAAGINAGSGVSGDYTTDDYEGNTRTNPDVGFDEYSTSSTKRMMILKVTP